VGHKGPSGRDRSPNTMACPLRRSSKAREGHKVESPLVKPPPPARRRHGSHLGSRRRRHVGRARQPPPNESRLPDVSPPAPAGRRPTASRRRPAVPSPVRPPSRRSRDASRRPASSNSVSRRDVALSDPRWLPAPTKSDGKLRSRAGDRLATGDEARASILQSGLDVRRVDLERSALGDEQSGWSDSGRATNDSGDGHPARAASDGRVAGSRAGIRARLTDLSMRRHPARRNPRPAGLCDRLLSSTSGSSSAQQERDEGVGTANQEHLSMECAMPRSRPPQEPAEA